MLLLAHELFHVQPFNLCSIACCQKTIQCVGGLAQAWLLDTGSSLNAQQLLALLSGFARARDVLRDRPLLESIAFFVLCPHQVGDQMWMGNSVVVFFISFWSFSENTVRSNQKVETHVIRCSNFSVHYKNCIQTQYRA